MSTYCSRYIRLVYDRMVAVVVVGLQGAATGRQNQCCLSQVDRSYQNHQIPKEHSSRELCHRTD